MKTSCMAVLLLLTAVASFAQTPTVTLVAPNSDVYVGYITTFPDYGNQYNSFRLGGVEAAYSQNLRPHFSLVGSVAAVFGTGYDVTQFSATVGPKLNLLTGRVRPYVTGQVGFAYQSSNGMYAGDHHPPLAKGTTDVEDGFTYRIGGGLDVQLNHKLYWRAMQWDYQPMPWGRHTPYYQNWSTGIGYRF